MVSELPARARALALTQAWLKAHDFAWWGADCARLLQTHLRNSGHEAPGMPRYRSALGARRALRRMGHAGLPELLDSLGLERIPAARMLPGDVAWLPGDPAVEGDAGLGTIVILVGRKAMGWHGDGGPGVEMTVKQWGPAWRLPPKESVP